MKFNVGDRVRQDHIGDAVICGKQNDDQEWPAAALDTQDYVDARQCGRRCEANCPRRLSRCRGHPGARISRNRLRLYAHELRRSNIAHYRDSRTRPGVDELKTVLLDIDEIQDALDASWSSPCDHRNSKACSGCNQQREAEWIDKYGDALVTEVRLLREAVEHALTCVSCAEEGRGCDDFNDKYGDKS